MPSLVEFTTPLAASATVSSGPQFIPRGTQVTGTVFADQAGTIYIDQGGDGINWDTTVTSAVAAEIGAAIKVDIISQYFQVRYINGTTAQTQFRLYVDPRDPYGSFLANALPPSPGGAFAILLFNQTQGNYQYVGRYDGADALGAITAAVNYKGQGGKYAAFEVATAIVSDETPVFQTEHSPDSF